MTPKPSDAADNRHPACVEAWPDCEDGAYNPNCCRFPKSCSCTIRRDAPPSDAAANREQPRHEYDSPVPQVEWLSAPSPLRSELIAAFNVLISRIERLEADRADA